MNDITETAILTRAEDGALVVQILTHEDTGRVRVWLNDAALYEGDPERDEAPQARTLASAGARQLVVTMPDMATEAEAERVRVELATTLEGLYFDRESGEEPTIEHAPHTDGWKWHPMPLSDHAPIATTTDLRPGMDAPVPDGEYLAAGTGDDGIALVVTVGVLRGRVVTLWAAVS